MLWLHPIFAWSLIGLAYIPILYMLRRRYIDTPIPSTLLWRRAMADRSANKPIQKIKRSIMMAFQMVIVLCLCLALMRPTFSAMHGGDLTLIFDLSVSMMAEDGGASRLNRSILDAQRMINNLDSTSRVNIITAGEKTLQPLSQSVDRIAARRVLNDLSPTYAVSDLSQSLSLARALQADNPSMRTICYTGQFIHEAIVKAPFSGTDNAAILSLAPNENKALVRVANYGVARELTVECYADGNLFDARSVFIEDGATESVMFDVPANYKILSAALPQSDALELDNRFDFAVKSDAHHRVLLAGSGNIFLESAIALRPDITLTRSTAKEAAALLGYALYIFDGDAPETLPANGNIIIFPNQMDIDAPAQLTAAHNHLARTLTKDLPLDGIAIKAYAPVVQGTEILLANDQPVLTYEPSGSQSIARFGFALYDSNLPVKMDFPILIQNLLSHLLPNTISGADNLICGQSITLTPDPLSVRSFVTLPSGVTVQSDGSTQFVDTWTPGIYAFSQQIDDETRVDFFTVNASRVQSDLRNVPQNSELNPAIQPAIVGTGRDLMPWLIAAALILMLTEWWGCRYGL